MTDRISIAAAKAGQWWSDRLDSQYADKRESFAQAVAARVEDVLSGKFRWGGNRKFDGNLVPQAFCYTACETNPRGLLLDAVVEVIDPHYKGGRLFKARHLAHQAFAS